MLFGWAPRTGTSARDLRSIRRVWDPRILGAELPRAGQAALVTLGYPEIGHQLRELLCLLFHAGPAGSRWSPVTPRHGGRSPQETATRASVR
jgi:hypothetical protein